MQWHFPVAKMSKAQWSRDRNMDVIVKLFCCTWPENSSLQWELVRFTATVYLSTSLVGSSKYFKHSPASGCQVINISSNILPIRSSFSQNWSLDTLWGWLPYTPKPKSSRFLKQNKPVWEEPPCSGHLSVADAILRSRWCPP